MAAQGIDVALTVRIDAKVDRWVAASEALGENEPNITKDTILNCRLNTIFGGMNTELIMYMPP